jgi:hypothetical protein
MKKRFGLTAFAVLLALSLVGGAANAGDKERVTEFDVHVGDALILGIGLPAVDIAGASNGDTIELLFTGRIDVEDHEAQGKVLSGTSIRAASSSIGALSQPSV